MPPYHQKSRLSNTNFTCFVYKWDNRDDTNTTYPTRELTILIIGLCYWIRELCNWIRDPFIWIIELSISITELSNSITGLNYLISELPILAYP